MVRIAMIVAVLFVQVASAAGQANPPARAPKGQLPALPLTPEGYRDAVVNIADAVNSFQQELAPQMLRGRCIFIVDTAQAKLAAQFADDLGKKWSRLQVPDSLKSSHAEILKWIESVPAVLKGTPQCVEGGSLELVYFLAKFGDYSNPNAIREKTRSLLDGMGVTLPPIPKKP